MQRFISLIITFTLSLFTMVNAFAQVEILGSAHPDTNEASYAYTLYQPEGPTLYTKPAYSITGTGGGTVLSTGPGPEYATSIKFTTPGSATLWFKNGTTVIASLSLTIVTVPTPPAITPIVSCGSTQVNLPAPAGGVTYYWQTLATGKSTTDTAPFKTVTTAGTTLYIRGKWNGFNNWGALSTVNPTVSVMPTGTVTGPQPFYSTGTGTLSLSMPNGGAVEKWQKRAASPAGGAWVDVPNSASLTSLAFSSVDESTEFRALMGNAPGCTGVPSAAFTATVVQQNFEGRITGTSLVRTTTNTGTLQLVNCTGTVDEWQFSDNGRNFQTDGGAGSTTHPFSNLAASRYYRVKVSKKGTQSFTPIFVVNWAPAMTENLAAGNFVIAEAVRVKETFESNISTLPPTKKSSSYTFYDGVGRPVQQVAKSASPLQNDVIGFSVYDNLGHQTKTYLPYTGTGSTYYSQPATAQEDFYDNPTSKVAIDDKPFAETKFDGSPLDRVIEQGRAGASWQLAGGHTQRVLHRSNTASEVRIWKADATSSGYYAENTLRVTEVTDENNTQTIVYTDKRGLVVKKKTQADNNVWLTTLYIYDATGHAKYVLQPEGVKQLGAATTISATLLTQHAFRYTYDIKGRVAEKLAPGVSAPVYVAYDPLERPVLMQDGNLRATNQWMFVKYDGKGRPVMQGLYTNATQTTQAAMQTLLDGLYASGNATYPANAWFEERGATLHGYTNVSFPKTNADNSAIAVLTVNFYDSYDFDDADATADFGYVGQSLPNEETQPQGNAYALPTGSKRLVLGTTTWLYSYVFYDQYARPIQVRTNNHLNATVDNLETVVYDFEGKTLCKKTFHKAGTSQTTVINTYEYDPAGRLLKVSQSNNGAADQLLAQYEYNELGQVVDKKLHNTGSTNFLQSVDYRYTISGTLKSINNAQLTANSQNDETNDYFGLELLYETQDADLNNTVLFNGNVSAVKWKGMGAAEGADNQKGYVYSYDKAGRLLAATSKMSAGSTWNQETNVHDETMTYDDNGNIKTLKRNQRKHTLTGTTASYVSEMTDDLTYTYAGNTVSKVEDAIAFAAGQTGFNNGSTVATEYTYNNTGSLTADLNKGISSIAYNELGKPSLITFADTRKVAYTYDAAGTKLTVKNYAAGSSTPASTTDYVGSFMYENGVLSIFGSPEGRVVNKAGVLEYQYAIQDHQGNTRVVFTSATSAPDKTASFEGDTNDGSGSQYTVDTNFIVSFVGANHTTGGTKVVKMNQTNKIGPLRSLAVYPGDKVDIDVWEYHEGTSGFGTVSTPATTLVTMIAGAFGGAPGGAGESGLIYTGVNDAVAVFGTAANPGDAQPAAFLNYILFDKNYHVLDMGWQPAPATTFTKQQITFPTLKIKEEGKLFVYLSYDDESSNWVYFDDLRVAQTKTNVVQYNEYYPFGLQAGTSWTRADNKNNFLGNGGTEVNATTGLYDLAYRNYDPTLGRFHQVDPLTDSYLDFSGYNYAMNDPANLNDPLGDDPGGYDNGRPGEKALRRIENLGGHWNFNGVNGHQSTSFSGSGASDFSGGVYVGSDRWEVDRAQALYRQDVLALAKAGNVAALRAYTEWYGIEYEKWDRVYETTTASGVKDEEYLYSYWKPASEQGAWFQTHHTGILYSKNETKAYKDIWKDSFDSKGNVTRENHAWITDKGVLVLPTYNNTYNKSDFTVLPTKQMDGKWYVEYKNDWLRILGSIHTHPNNWKSGMSNTDQYLFFKGPAFALDHQNLMVGWIGPQGEFKFGDLMTHDTFKDSNFSIISNLAGILKTLK
ncbi:DUF6443 domain-containing protein [Chryseolinea lacunae]|uniref:RHS repeat-associated core domain-containing protein n=1 Tax=Chryseolinea lacunae TaxID=2801331 RepID=A0ABS1L1H7_9BACT|nr:DUF6443 domain-containing protein [Chryseolinea lacunae]MBL0745362.1 RHS repeat-associated core domain-containing protein [Chryseolinea lacunae]